MALRLKTDPYWDFLTCIILIAESKVLFISLDNSLHFELKFDLVVLLGHQGKVGHLVLRRQHVSIRFCQTYSQQFLG